MASISSLGIGSGLDLGSLVDSLLTAERRPIENSLNRQESRLSADLSGIGLMKSALSGFQSSLANLDDAATYNTRITSNSNSAALTVSSASDAELGAYNIDINNLATNQSLASAAYSSVIDSVGSGTIQIRYGTITGPGFTSFAPNADKTVDTITVDSSNNTLIGLKDHINNGNYGVSAAIINDGSGYRLTLTSEDSGIANAMEINITDTEDANNLDSAGLSALAYNAAAVNLTQTQAAQDAKLSVNGLPITSARNTLDDVIEGVTLTLRETTTASVSLTVSESSTKLSGSIRDLVDSYNEMVNSLDELSFAGVAGGQAGLLFGDVSLRNFTNGLRRMITSQVDGLNGSITALSNIGIRTQSDGTLSIDETTFAAAIAENPTDALALFVPVGQTTDSLVAFNSSNAISNPGSYAINLSAIATQGSLNGGSGVSNLTVDANNDNFTLLVDGLSSGSLSLSQGVYATADALAAEMQSQINSASAFVIEDISVAVNYDSANDRFVITSNAYGSDSNVEITTIDTNSNADFGFSVASGTAGIDVAGTIGGIAATGSGQTLSINSGLSVDILGGATGARGTLKFSRGFVENLNELLDSYLDPSSGTISSREDGLNSSLEDLADQRIALNLRMTAVEQRLVSQFTALDQLLAQFQTTGNFIAQQVGNLPGSGQLVNK